MIKRLAISLASLCVLSACSQQAPTPAVVVLRDPVRSGADLHCSLPVVSAGRIGFVDFPSGSFRTDLTAPSDHSWLVYAHGAHRWVRLFNSLGAQLVSPDGNQVVEVENAPDRSGYSDVYGVDVDSQRKHSIGQVAGPARPISWQPDAIYLNNGFIVRLDLRTGKSTALHPTGPDVATANAGLWFWISPQYAWYSQSAGPNQADRNPILSLSLQDGALTTWYRAPAGRSVSILGFVTANEPLIVEFNREPYDRMTGVVYMVLTAPGVTRSLDLDSTLYPWGMTDSMGVWMSSPGHVWLYNTSGLHAMADVTGAFGSHVPGIGAGPCA